MRFRNPIPKRLRRKANRSGTQSCPICLKQEILVEHHLDGRNIKDAERSSNKVFVCANCHSRIHHGKIIVEGIFLTTYGLQLIWREANQPSITNQATSPPLFQS